MYERLRRLLIQKIKEISYYSTLDANPGAEHRIKILNDFHLKNRGYIEHYGLNQYISKLSESYRNREKELIDQQSTQKEEILPDGISDFGDFQGFFEDSPNAGSHLSGGFKKSKKKKSKKIKSKKKKSKKNKKSKKINNLKRKNLNSFM